MDFNWLAYQFVRVRREFVSGGRLRALWCRAKSDCLAPFLPLLLVGRAHDPAHIRWTDLQVLSGLTDERLFNALEDLDTYEVIRIDRGHGRSVIRFSVGPRVLSESNYFVMPGSLLRRRRWSGMTESERATLTALSGLAKSEIWDFKAEVMKDDPECGWWAYNLDDLEATDFGQHKVRRAGRVTLTQLSGVVGMSRSAASRALRGLSERDDGRLIECCQSAHGLWYQLPEAVWWSGNE